MFSGFRWFEPSYRLVVARRRSDHQRGGFDCQSCSSAILSWHDFGCLWLNLWRTVFQFFSFRRRAIQSLQFNECRFSSSRLENSLAGSRSSGHHPQATAGWARSGVGGHHFILVMAFFIVFAGLRLVLGLLRAGVVLCLQVGSPVTWAVLLIFVFIHF